MQEHLFQEHADDQMPAQWDDEPPDAVRDYFTAAQMHAYGEACAAAEREALVAIVGDDAAAMAYQTLGQYRTALLAAVRAR